MIRKEHCFEEIRKSSHGSCPRMKRESKVKIPQDGLVTYRVLYQKIHEYLQARLFNHLGGNIQA